MNLAAVEQATGGLLARGERLLHLHRFADTDDAHCAQLLAWANLPPGARVVDLGCGTGELAARWTASRPDLTWLLVNLSPLQLAAAPTGLPQWCGDMRTVPEPDGAFDAAVCVFAIGHEALDVMYREMARLVRPGGVVWVYDLTAESSPHLGVQLLDYHVGTAAEMEASGRAAGLTLDSYHAPVDDPTRWAERVGADGVGYFEGTSAGIWRWMR